jgi:hypothetical protein
MAGLLCEFKQGNKLLVKIEYHPGQRKGYYVMCKTSPNCFLTGYYEEEKTAVNIAHNYIIGKLSIKQNQNYTMLHYERISQYIQVYKYVYSGGELVKDGKLYKTIAA